MLFTPIGMPQCRGESGRWPLRLQPIHATREQALMKTLFVGNIAPGATENDIKDLFSEYGTVRKLEMPRDIFTGKCKGFAFVDMEGHEARAASAVLDGKFFMNNNLKVRDEKPKQKGKGRRR
jgi:RNA recognition motif-containing protein